MTPREVPQRAMSRETILVVDDEQHIIELGMYLENETAWGVGHRFAAS
jgi:hypothetical protein